MYCIIQESQSPKICNPKWTRENALKDARQRIDGLVSTNKKRALNKLLAHPQIRKPFTLWWFQIRLLAALVHTQMTKANNSFGYARINKVPTPFSKQYGPRRRGSPPQGAGQCKYIRAWRHAARRRWRRK
ncbi:hypothetical protein BC936DRAFT_147638 [Jimgerdemannia flammicorona]|uniref:Uncharacterized protein n=1 Tax=Jimgerdemannia flammicorona TaxID=994334 RepID=A0A433D4V6_9FUNG|nr:hypothetical protein BC936DRAFT_147638 [Jimgerdemannia flammicorona]